MSEHYPPATADFYRPVPGGPAGPHEPVPQPAYGSMPPSYPGYPGFWPTVPPPPDPMPAAGTPYVHFLRTGWNRWWKGVVAIVLLALGYLGFGLGLSLAAITLDLATGRISQESLLEGRLVITPALLLAINLGAAALIPLSMLLQWGLWGQPVRWIHSVRGHLRWGLLGRLALIIVPVWLVYLGLSVFFLPPPPGDAFTGESAALLAIVLLTTPLQAAGEEYGARGLIARAAGSWFAGPRLALMISTVVSAAIFTLAHGAANPWLIAYFFGFGVAMSIVVWRTGGLEVAIVIHTVNNLLIFAFAIVGGQDLSATLDRGADVGGSYVLVPLVVVGLAVAGVWWWSKRKGIATAYTPPAVPPELGAVAAAWPVAPQPTRTSRTSTR